MLINTLKQCTPHALINESTSSYAISQYLHCTHKLDLWANRFLSCPIDTFDPERMIMCQMVDDCVHHVALNPKCVLNCMSINQGAVPGQSLKTLSSTLLWSYSMHALLVWFGSGLKWKQVKILISLHRHLMNNTIRDGMIIEQLNKRHKFNHNIKAGNHSQKLVESLKGKSFHDHKGKLPDVIMECNLWSSGCSDGSWFWFFNSMAFYDVYPMKWNTRCPSADTSFYQGKYLWV